MLLGLAVLLMVSFFILKPTDEPHYQGRSLSEWLVGQKRAEPEYLRQYFSQAAAVGETVDWSDSGGTTSAMPPS